MKKEIISALHVLKLLLLTQKKFENVWVFSLSPFIFLLSNYILVQDIFHLYYTLSLSDPRKHLLNRKKTLYQILYIFINLIFIGVYFYAVPQELILLLFMFLVIFLHRLLYKSSLVETENLNFYNDLSLGYGAALCYYENYLKYILREPRLNLVTRIRMFKSVQRINNLSNKLFILIPNSCKVKTYIDELKPISRCKELIPVEKNIAGIPNRKFNITVYHIRCDDNPQKSVRLALEYAQPLKVLFSLKEKGLLSIEDMHKQREIFTSYLKEMLSKSENSKEIHLVEYDDELPSHVLSEVLMKVEAVYQY